MSTPSRERIEAAAKALAEAYVPFKTMLQQKPEYALDIAMRALAAADAVAEPREALAGEAKVALMALVAECRPDEDDHMCAAPPQAIYEMANEVAQRCHRDGPVPNPLAAPLRALIDETAVNPLVGAQEREEARAALAAYEAQQEHP